MKYLKKELDKQVLDNLLYFYIKCFIYYTNCLNSCVIYDIIVLYSIHREDFNMEERCDYNLELLGKRDNVSINKLAEVNLPLVKSISKKFLNRGYEYEDIFQIGCVGLVKAINKFDFSFGVAFSAYAVPMITGEIKRFLRDDGIVRIPRPIKAAYIKVRYAYSELYNKYSRKPTTEELSTYLNISKDIVEEVTKMNLKAIPDSLNRIIHDPQKSGTDITVCDKVTSNFNLEDTTIQKIDLETAINKLPILQKRIVLYRMQDYTQTKIAEILNINQVAVSRIEKKAYIELKRILTGGNMSKREEAIKMFKKGDGLNEVTKKLGITKSSAMTYKTYYNRETGKSKHTTSKKLDAFKMFSQKFKCKVIAEKLNLTAATVQGYQTEFFKLKDIVFKALDNNKTEEMISKEFKIDISIIKNLRHEWATTPLKEENIVTTGIKEADEVEKKTKQTSIANPKPTKEAEQTIKQEIKEFKEDGELKTDILKITTLKGKVMKYDLEDGNIKITNAGEEVIKVPSDQLDGLIEELQALKEVI